MASEKSSQKAAKTNITVCGSDKSGKTSLIYRILYDTFPKASLSTQATQVFNETYSPTSEDKKSITCYECVNNEHPFYQAANTAYCLHAKHNLIVLDIKKLPTSEELKKYFTLASDYAPIHLVINKIDQFNENEAQNLINLLLQEAQVTPAYTHYISTQNNQGIQALREYLDIPNPSYRATLQATADKPTTKNSLSKETIAKIVLVAITAGFIVGGVAGLLGGPALGVVVGMWVAAITLNAIVTSNIPAEKFSKNTDQSLPDAILEDNLEKKPGIEPIPNNSEQSSKPEPSAQNIQLDFITNSDLAQQYLEHHSSPLNQSKAPEPVSTETSTSTIISDISSQPH